MNKWEKSYQKDNYFKCKTKPEVTTTHKIHIIHSYAFGYKWVANLNLSFLVAKAMIEHKLLHSSVPVRKK